MAKRGLKGFIILIISVFLDGDSISLHNPLHELLHQQADDVLNLSLTVELLHSGSDGLQSLLVTEDGEEDECWVEDDVVLHQVDQVEGDEVQDHQSLAEAGLDQLVRCRNREGGEGSPADDGM